MLPWTYDSRYANEIELLIYDNKVDLYLSTWIKVICQQMASLDNERMNLALWMLGVCPGISDAILPTESLKL